MARSTASALTRIYDLLHAAYGPQYWWPARTRDEIVIGAVLAQNTAWPNAARAIAKLREADRLSLRRIHRTPPERLARLIRSSGTHRVKARRLLNLTGWLEQHFDGDLDALFDLGVVAARRGLLTVNGIGPETADAILLYAGGLPTFVVDAYTQRVLRRHRLIGPQADYQQTKALFERALPRRQKLFAEYHALLVAVGKHHCRPRARCMGCPLEALPHDADR